MLLNLIEISAKINASFLIRLLLTITTSSLLIVSANASTLISTTNYLEYELPKSIQEQCYEQNNCPQIEIKYLKTNHEWINDITNKHINELVINSKPTDSIINDKAIDSSARNVKMAIDDFAESQFIDIPNGSSWSYNLLVTPAYLGHVQLGQNEDLELFEINYYVFTGGAHGMSFIEYMIFDPSTKSQVKLADVLQVDKQPYFEALAYDAYRTWVQTIDKDVNSYEENWPFLLSDNITLTDKGVDIRYQQYDIGPYAYGMPVLSIPYSKLNGIIRPRFMAK